MKIPLPEGEYVKRIDIDNDGLVVEFEKKKKVALVFISINERYWPYLQQVMEDCKTHFLPQHHVDMFAWTDMPKEKLPLAKDVFETEAIDWPAPTLMRYHLFLDQEEVLKEYEYIFYLDADMRVVQKITDDILGTQLTAAPHPGYVLNSKLIPPYEPNRASQAYIQRLGQITLDEKNQQRFLPFYAAGGFQGGTAEEFIKAMKVMKANIDKDFNQNYTAIWNDESHWNKYLWDFQANGGHITFLDVSYVYPDSLIKEYYIPTWGRDYEPKIITLTKPWQLSKQAAEQLGFGSTATYFTCPTCQESLDVTGFRVLRLVACPGKGQPHQLEMQKI